MITQHVMDPWQHFNSLAVKKLATFALLEFSRCVRVCLPVATLYVHTRLYGVTVTGRTS